MCIYAFDIDITGSLHGQDPYYLGEPEKVSKFFTSRQVVFLPDCERSHEIVGEFFLNNITLNTHIITEPVVYDLCKYSDFTEFFPGVRFYKVPGWEMIIDHNVFNKTLSIYFRPLPNWRKPKHEVHNDNSELRW